MLISWRRFLRFCRTVTAWLTEAAKDEHGPSDGYVLVIEATAPHHQRIARAISLGLMTNTIRLKTSLDVTFVDAESAKVWEQESKDCVIYRRQWSGQLDGNVMGRV
jgi:hypothetical protein